MAITISYRIGGLTASDGRDEVHVTFDPVEAIVWPGGEPYGRFARPDVARRVYNMMSGAGAEHEDLLEYFERVFSRGLRPGAETGA